MERNRESLKTRITEHKRAVSSGIIRNANTVYCMKTSHSMEKNAVTLVDRDIGWRSKRVYSTYQEEKDLQHGLGVPHESMWNSLVGHIEN